MFGPFEGPEMSIERIVNPISIVKHSSWTIVNSCKLSYTLLTWWPPKLSYELTNNFSESVWAKGSSNSGGPLYIFTSSHLHIFTSTHAIFTYSHLHIFTSSHLHIFTYHLRISSPLHIFWSSHLHISSSHIHILSSHIIFASSHLHIPFSRLHIFASSHLTLTSSHLLSLSLSLFFFSLLRPRAVLTRRHEMATLSHEMMVDRQKLK